MATKPNPDARLQRWKAKEVDPPPPKEGKKQKEGRWVKVEPKGTEAEYRSRLTAALVEAFARAGAEDPQRQADDLVERLWQMAMWAHMESISLVRREGKLAAGGPTLKRSLDQLKHRLGDALADGFAGVNDDDSDGRVADRQRFLMQGMWWATVREPDQPGDPGEGKSRPEMGKALSNLERLRGDRRSLSHAFRGALIAEQQRLESWDRELREAEGTAAVRVDAAYNRSLAFAVETLGEVRRHREGRPWIPTVEAAVALWRWCGPELAELGVDVIDPTQARPCPEGRPDTTPLAACVRACLRRHRRRRGH